MRQQVPNAIKFWLLASVALAVGCSGPTGSAVNASVNALADESKERPRIFVPQPEDPGPADLGIVHEDQIVRMGDPRDAVLEVFPAPAKAPLFREDLPVISDSLKAEAWEAPAKRCGFITTRGKVVLIVFTEEKVSESRINDVIADHERRFGPAQVVVPHDNFAYRFWSKGTTKLMISESIDTRSRRSITIAMGFYELMDALRMSAKAAESDQAEASRILENLRAGKGN